jgi:signal peptidase I
MDRKTIGKGLWQFFNKQVRPILVIVLVLCAFRSSVADWNDVPTQSMEPTILTGDRIAVNKLAYDLKVPFTKMRVARWGDPEPGDVVILFSPANSERMVKRIIGTPGDRVAMMNNRLIVNGKPLAIAPTTVQQLGADDLTDPPPHAFATEQLGDANHPIMALPARGAKRSFKEVTVPAGQYLVMGDNRDNSRDSRFWGFVPRDQIVGRVFGVAFSLDHDNHYLPRWRRFFRDID